MKAPEGDYASFQWTVFCIILYEIEKGVTWTHQKEKKTTALTDKNLPNGLSGANSCMVQAVKEKGKLSPTRKSMSGRDENKVIL